MFLCRVFFIAAALVESGQWMVFGVDSRQPDKRLCEDLSESKIEDVFVDKNNVVHLHCKSERKIYDENVWTKDRRSLPDEQRLIRGEIAPVAKGEMVDALFYLVILNAQPGDSGIYTCGEGRGAANYSLVVEDPEISTITDVEGSESSSFQCEFTTLFAPIIEWRKDGSLISSSGNHYISHITALESLLPSSDPTRPQVKIRTTKSTLYIRDVASLDSGNYSCIVSNSPDFPYWRDMVLTVKDPAERFPARPSFNLDDKIQNNQDKIDRNIESFILNPGGVAVFQCLLKRVDFEPDFVWKKDGSLLNLKDKRYDIRYLDSSQHLNSRHSTSTAGKNNYESILSIFLLKLGDSGNYTCHIIKSGVEYHTQAFELKPTDRFPKLPSFNLEDNSDIQSTENKRTQNRNVDRVQSLTRGGVAVFQCLVENLDFKPEFIWKKDGAALDPTYRRYDIRSIDSSSTNEGHSSRSVTSKKNYKSILTIFLLKPTDAGKYTCLLTEPEHEREHTLMSFRLVMDPY